MSGAGSAYAQALLSAADEALACARDSKRFMNESEAVLARLHRALIQLERQGYGDHGAILDSVPQKESIVHFLHDCVRNRFLAQRKVSYMRDMLAEGHRSWTRAFRQHLAGCETCQTVDLERERPAGVPPERWPIPFLLELLAVAGLALPLAALGQGCGCAARPWLLLLGLLLTLPLIVFERRWRSEDGRGLLLELLVAGEYAVGARQLKVGRLWCPSRHLHLGPRAAPSGRGAGGGSSASGSASGSSAGGALLRRGFASFGEWHCQKPPTATASVRRRPSDPHDSSSSASSDSEGEGVVQRLCCFCRRWRLRAGIVSEQPALVAARGAGLLVTCEAKGWKDRHSDWQPAGKLAALNASFDGDAVHFGTGEVWAKLGCLRLAWCRKFLLSLAMLGVVMASVAVLFAPGLVWPWRCGPQYHTRKIKAPMEVFFLLDASASVSDASWTAEKGAAAEILDAFADVYGGSSSNLTAGVAQFSTATQLASPISNDLARVKTTIRTMPQVKGATYMAAAVSLCQLQLLAYVMPGLAPGARPFKICVMITDGEASDPKEVGLAKRVLKGAGIQLMGIYVGDNDASREKMRRFACDESATLGLQTDADCLYFASASDFRELQQRAQEIARDVTVAANTTVITEEYACPSPPYWTLLGLLWSLPALAWWIWLHLIFAVPEAESAVRKDPLRLRAAGANEHVEMRPAAHPAGGVREDREGAATRRCSVQ